MKSAVTTILASLLLTACGSNAPETDTTKSSAAAVQVTPPTPKTCSWGEGGFVASDTDAPPTSGWTRTVTVTASEGEREYLPSTFKPFTANYLKSNDGTVWISFVSTDLNDTESCPDFIDDGGLHFTFAVLDGGFEITASFTNTLGNTAQLTWGS